MARVTITDLAFCKDWIEAYEVSEGDEANGASVVRLAAWLKAEIENRETEALIRRGAKLHGVSLTVARKAYRNRTRKQVKPAPDTSTPVRAKGG